MATTRPPAISPKGLLELAIAKLPDDATVEEAVDALYVALKVGKGSREVGEGKGVSQEDVEESLDRWLE